MRILKVDHIGIAVKDLNESLKFYQEGLGLKLHEVVILQDQKAKIAILKAGDCDIELLESTDTEGPIARFIKKRGEGIQHFAFAVSNIEEAIRELKTKGIAMVDEKPRVGAKGIKMAFCHPKSTNGVLLELISAED